MDSTLKRLMENNGISFKKGLNLLRKSLRGKTVSLPKNISRNVQTILESTKMPVVLNTVHFETPGKGEETGPRDSIGNNGMGKLNGEAERSFEEAEFPRSNDTERSNKF